jgi:polygalacturonase
MPSNHAASFAIIAHRFRRVFSIHTLILVSGILAGACTSVAQETATQEKVVGWNTVPGILAQIVPPTFPERDFVITNYKAVGDGQADCKPALDQAIAACHEAGGGRVVVPEGDWFVKGPIHLKSNVNLHLQAGATIRFSTEPDDYLPVVFTRFEGNEVMNFSPLVYAYEQENIAVTGQGVLDGQAGKDAWWQWKGAWGGEVDHGWRPGQPYQGNDANHLRQMGDADVPSRERVFGQGHTLRPSFVQPYLCKNVLIEGVTVINSPMWIIHPVLSENVTIRGVTVNSHGPNNDGCDPESCRNVLIENCLFDTGDDCIAIKSGRNADGRRIGVPSENIIIRGCTMKDGHGGVVLGSEMSGGIRNVFAEDCDMDSPHLERAIRLKSNSLRGGYLENLFVRNIRVGEVSDAVVRINLVYDKDRGEFNPSVRNVYIENVTSEKSRYPFYFVGLDGQPIENVVIKDCTFKDAKEPSIIVNVGTITLNNFRLIPKKGVNTN